MYRNRTKREIRDIYANRAINGRWSEGSPVADERRRMPGCPVNVPAVAVSGHYAAVAWFTMAGNLPRVRLAQSTNSGKSFGPVIEIYSGPVLGRVDVELLDNGITMVS